MKLPLFFVACLAIPMAYAQHKHVHGEGTLNVVIDKDTLSISLELPLDAAVGFERAPKTAKETAALRDAEAALKDAATLFVPTPAAGCTVQSVAARVPFFGNTDHAGHGHEGETHHADIEAEYTFRCSQPAALKGFETTIFGKFTRLYRLETQRSGPVGQGTARLTPKKPALAW